jgi:hypothetical protein
MAVKSATYHCQARVRHDGKLYPPGETLALSTAQAEPLLALAAITPANSGKSGTNAPGGNPNNKAS